MRPDAGSDCHCVEGVQQRSEYGLEEFPPGNVEFRELISDTSQHCILNFLEISFFDRSAIDVVDIRTTHPS